MGEKLVVLGGTGFLGRHLAEALAATPGLEPVYVVHRTAPSWLSAVPVRTVRCGLDDAKGLAAIFPNTGLVVNLLRPDGRGERLRFASGLPRLLALGREPRLIQASSIDVYGDAPARVLTEASEPRPASPYAAEHLAIERLLLAEAPGCTVLRLGAVFGDGGRNVASFAREAAQAGRALLLARRLLYGARRMHLVSVEAVVAAILRLIGLPPARQPACLLVTDDDDERNNFGFVQDSLLEAFARQPFGQLPRLPYAVLEAALRLRARPHQGVRRRYLSRFGSLLDGARPDFGSCLTAYAQRLAAAHPRQ